MRELGLNEVEQVSGGSLFVDTGALGSLFLSSISPSAGMVTGSFFGGYQVGTDIYSSFSSQTQNAIGYTSYQMINNPIRSVENAFSYWF